MSDPEADVFDLDDLLTAGAFFIRGHPLFEQRFSIIREPHSQNSAIFLTPCIMLLL